MFIPDAADHILHPDRGSVLVDVFDLHGNHSFRIHALLAFPLHLSGQEPGCMFIGRFGQLVPGFLLHPLFGGVTEDRGDRRTDIGSAQVEIHGPDDVAHLLRYKPVFGLAIPEPVLGLPALRDVPGDTTVAHVPAFTVVDGYSARLTYPHGPILMKGRVFEILEGPWLFHETQYERPQAERIFAWYDIEKGPAHPVFRTIPQMVHDLLAHVGEAELFVGLPDQVARVLGQVAEPTLALAEGHLNLLAPRDVPHDGPHGRWLPLSVSDKICAQLDRYNRAVLPGVFLLIKF